MSDPYTPDALVQFIYREQDGQAAFLTTRSLESNPALMAVYRQLHHAKAQLPKVVFTPSSNVLNRILQYSASTAA